jgi:two-component system OmpR family sensor kinase/two-component system sensor histidine kinase BaeS
MNRLWLRLTLAFVVVTLVGIAMVTLLTDWSAGTQFRQFLMHQAMMSPGGLTEDLADYYQQNGNWNGVAKVIANAPSTPIGRGRGMGMTPAPHAGAGVRGGPPILFADANGRVVYDELGSRTGNVLSATDRANAVSVVSNGNTVGYLIAGAMRSDALAPAEQSFLNDLRQTLVIAALVAGSLGIILGLIVSRTLTAPLTDLANAARSFAGRDWSRRVRVGGTDEMAMVGREFNAMADAIQRGEEQRRALVADIAHELRTPLTVVQGNLRAMLDEVYPIEKKEIATIYDETRLLSRLVDDLRELALAESGQLELKSKAVDLGAILSAAATNFSAAADAHNVSLDVQMLETPRVRGDPDRIAQILRNLLTNALRHTPSGGRIMLSVTQDRNVVRVNVSDTGEGITPEDLPRVFDRFYRADKSRTRSEGGSGLGLAIAKSWVEAMGGQIRVESELGKGTRFEFQLPRG